MKYLIRNATIVNEGKVYQASVLIEDGIITKIVSPHKFVGTNAKIINGVGLFLFPGIIDTHVHFRDPGSSQKGDFESESKAAVMGGVTSVVDMPNTNPQTTTEEALDAKIQLISGRSWANFGFMVGATNDNIAEIIAIPKDKLAGIKLFLGSSTGNMLVDNKIAIAELFEKSEKIIVAHCEDEQRIQENTERIRKELGENPPASCHPLVRDVEACCNSTLNAIKYVRKGKARLHIAHLSTKEELEILKEEHCRRITAEACVNYLWFDDKDYASLGNRLKCNPAIKSAEDREALLQGLNTNLLYTIGTDHAPHTLEEKEQPYFSSPSGIPSIQFSLQMMLELYHQGLVSLETIVEKMCHNPAKLFNIEKRGFIKEGHIADLVLVDLNANYEVNKDNIHYKCGWSPLEGICFHSAIKFTMVNGEVAFDESHSVAEICCGERLSFL